MAKINVERPRKIDSVKRRGRGLPDDVMPKAVGLRRHLQEAGGFKMLNENLSPLRRHLERQVGRPWNKVFSEIAANLKATSTVQQHVRDHIKDFVQLHPSADVRKYLWSERRWFQPFYVDPELDEPRAWAAYRQAQPARRYAVGKRQLSRAVLRGHGLANSAG